MKLPTRAITLFACSILAATLFTGCAARMVHKLATSGDKTDEKTTPEQALRAANSELYLAINMVLAGKCRHD